MARQNISLAVLSGNSRDTAWRHLAACLGADPELFFPVSSTGAAAAGIHAAKAFCRRCPVRDRCLTYAVDTGQTAGIWGGCDENERRLMRQQHHPDTSVPHAVARRQP